MRFPQINLNLNKRTSAVEKFGGLNQNIIATDGEWADMRNISDRLYPAIASRPARGTSIKSFTEPKGFIHKNGLFYIDGTSAYFNDVAVFSVPSSEPIMVGMGAYVCVFPEGKMYNTFKMVSSDMAAEASYSATFAPLSKNSVYTKITASGIGNTFKKGDGVKIGGYDDNYHIIIDSDTDYITISGQRTDTTTINITVVRDIPSMDFVCERDNRVWGCSSANHEVYCCKSGDPTNWHAYETTADMAYAATVGSDGDFTGIAKFGSYILFFKETCVHILRGDKPANFSLTEKQLPGVKSGCSRSVQVINDTLYYVGMDGVYAYDGSIPQKISSCITSELSDAVSCQQDGKLYMSCKMNGTQTLLVYDPKTNIWDVEDGETFKYAEFSGGKLYYIDADNNLKNIYGSSTDAIEWYMESVDLRENSLEEKYISRLEANIWLAAGSEITILYKADDEALWHKKGYIRSTRNKTYTVPIKPQRCNKYRLRFEGRGEFKLLAMSKMVEGGSNINGSIQRQRIR